MISDFPSSEEAELRRDYAASRKRLGLAAGRVLGGAERRAGGGTEGRAQATHGALEKWEK